ncbi:hypothetical protein A1Q2_01820 [Trichosporon asahii var. asahii CBS 8904]|uniref:Sec20 C-terminal domain-containing protein n=1 Tax=Trichosporon asahii var. asahii (strain CBS 8904) TaxID=1220162 RepID=K1VWH9_TRIAC|nr:hypothetical protein A1Q2_01820 [Trichosporon asahii var. asahii CBS 8904]
MRSWLASPETSESTCRNVTSLASSTSDIRFDHITTFHNRSRRMAQEIFDTLPALARRLADVREYQIPRLAQSTTLARDLAGEARADLESVRVGLEDARETAELAGARREELLSQVLALEDEWARCVALFTGYRADNSVHRAYRTALVDSKGNQATADARYELDESRLQPEIEESSGVVGVLSVQMLDSSTETLRSTQSLYERYNDLLGASGKIVKALEKADWWDRAIIAAAFTFFLLCVAYVIKRRVLDRVGGFAAWWVGGSFRLLRMGLTGKPARRVVEDVVTQGAAVASGAAVTGAAVAGAAGAAAGAVKQELDKKRAADTDAAESKSKKKSKKDKKKNKKAKKGVKEVKQEPDTVTIIEEVVPSEPADDSAVKVKVEL